MPIILIVVAIFLIILYAIVIIDIRKGKYKTKSNSILAQEAVNNYTNEFPNYSIQDLKIEIEKVADILVNHEASNRYTEALRQKSKNDDKMKILKKLLPNNVEIIKYVDGVLKARVKYQDDNTEYSLILSMNTVTTGKVFLNSYYIFRDKLTLASE